jgi:hypothetical protein
MSNVFIEGLGHVAIDSSKSQAEKEATIQYYRDVAPKYREQGGFMSGFNDTKSMIYRWGQKLSSTEDEERDRWYNEQIEEWGEMVGIYDSIALAKYYEDIKKNRKLNAGEQADDEANLAAYQDFMNDMHYAYDNREGDISDVQKKYGYDEEEIGVIEGLGMFADMFKENPSYAFGSIAGMIVKDPELLLLGYLGIPARTVQGGIRAADLANKAMRIQPKYTKKLGRFMQNSRVQAGIGRGVEGATYGGVYEALHDLTFKGHIKSENLERGLALGALLGTAFGGISGQVGNKNWFLSKTSSEQAAKRIKGNESKPKPTKKPDVNQSNANPKFRPVTPEEVILPDGLSHLGRQTLWMDRGIKILQDAWIKKNPDGSLAKAHIKSDHAKMVKLETARLKKQKIKSKPKYTADEIKGLAQKNVANKLEKIHKVDSKAERIRPTSDKKWGREREKAQGKQNIKDKKVERGAEEFSHRYDDTLSPPKEATLRQMGKAALIGGGAGYFIASEDKGYGSAMGMIAGIVARKYIKGVDINQAKLRMKFYSAADKSKSLQRMLELSTGKTMVVVAQILKGKSPKMTHKQFLTFVETYSTASTQKLMKTLTQQERNAIDAVRELMRVFKTEAKRYGILKNEQFITDYITHIFKNKPPKGAELKKIKKIIGQSLDDTTNHSKIRTLQKTIEQLSKRKEYAGRIETDVFKILDTYSRSMSKAIAGAHLVSVMKKVGILDGAKTMGVLVSNTEKVAERAIKMGYKTVDQPALKDMLVHPLVKNSLEDYFYTSVGSPLLMDRVIAVNNAMKRVAISLSFFHAQSLLLSAVYAGAYTFTKAGKVRMKKVRALMDGQWESNSLKINKKTGEVIGTTHNMLPDQVGDFTQAKLLRELAEYGVEIGVKANEFVDAGYSSVKAFYDKNLPPIGKAQDWIDKWTWDIMHDQLKVFTYLTVKERAMSSTPRGLQRIVPKKYLEAWRPLTEHEASEMSSRYVNDAFGGQRHTKLALEWQQKAIQNANNPKGGLYQWMALAATPSKAKFAQLTMFSPDWTISNIRIAFRGMGMTKDLVTKALVKGEKLTTRELAEWNQYAGYFVRGLISTSMLAYLANQLLADENTDFNLTDFWLTGRLQLGGGEEMVVSKQIAEPMHWLMHPLQTGLNKSATFPKAVLELFLGKQYISLKHGGIIGKSMDRESPKDLMSWMTGKLPISVSPYKRMIVDDDYSLSEANKAAVLGGTGFPIYKSGKY